MEKGCFGEELPKVYDDMDGVGELVTLSDQAAHRVVDKIVLACSAGNPHVKTAIVCPPTIYGPGRGPDNQRSAQAYTGAKCILQSKQGFLPCKGKFRGNHAKIVALSVANVPSFFGQATISGMRFMSRIYQICTYY